MNHIPTVFGARASAVGSAEPALAAGVLTAGVLGYAGRRVAVTGCASGIGRATAALLVTLGAEVHGLDLAGGDDPLAGFSPLDLRNRASIDDAVAALPPTIDALFNCAGVPPGPPALDVLTVNFIGPRYLTERLLERMTKGGSVVNVASNGGAGWRGRVPLLQEFVATTSFEEARAWYADRGEGLGAPYSFSKEALIVWTVAAAAPFARRALRINATTPGAVQTPMLDTIAAMVPAAAIDAMAEPIGRRSTAEEQAWPLVFLASEAAAYVNGAVLPVDGGFMAMRELVSAAASQPIGRR